MTLRWLLLLLMVSPFFWGCNSWKGVEWEQIEVEGIFSLELPSRMEPTEELHPDAVFQALNPSRELFLLVRRDTLAQLQALQPDFMLEDFLDLTIERLIAQLSDPKVPVALDTTIHQAPAYVATIQGFFKGEPIQYQLGVIQGRHYLYQLLIWHGTQKANLLDPVAKQILYSFREES